MHLIYLGCKEFWKVLGGSLNMLRTCLGGWKRKPGDPQPGMSRGPPSALRDPSYEEPIWVAHYPTSPQGWFTCIPGDLT